MQSTSVRRYWDAKPPAVHLRQRHRHHPRAEEVTETARCRLRKLPCAITGDPRVAEDRSPAASKAVLVQAPERSNARRWGETAARQDGGNAGPPADSLRVGRTEGDVT